MIEAFVEFAIMHFIFVVSPGATFIFLISDGLKFGINKAFYNLIGTAIGYALITILFIIGLMELLYNFPKIHNFIKYSGGIYLVYKSWQIWKNAGFIDEADLYDNSHIKSSKKNMMIAGFKVSLTNPQIGINMIALLSCFREYSMTAWGKFGVGLWMIIGYFIYFYILLKIFTNNYIRKKISPKMFYIERLLAFILLFLAIKIML